MPNTNTVTARYLDFQPGNLDLHALRREAVAAGDHAMADIVNRALTSDDDLVDQDGNRIALADMPRMDALAACADAINDARAQADAE